MQCPWQSYPSRRSRRPSSRCREVLTEIALLIPDAAKPIFDSIAQEPAPLPAEAKDPESVLVKVLGDKGPCAKVARMTELEADLTKLKAALATLSSGGDAVAEMREAMQVKVDAAQAALTKSAKEVPSQDHEYRAILEAKSHYELKIQERKDREQRGSLKAAERSKERHQHVAKLKLQVLKLEAGLKKLEEDNCAKHKARSVAAEALDAKVRTLIETKLAGLKAPAPASSSQPPPNTELGAPYGLTAPLALPDVAPRPVPSTLDELMDAKKLIARLQEQLEVGANRFVTEYEKNFEDIQPHQLPKPWVPAPELLPAVGALYQSLQSWATAGAVSPFDWKSLEPILGDKLVPTTVAQQLLGDTWLRFYDSGPPQPSAVVPKQVGLLIWHCLGEVN